MARKAMKWSLKTPEGSLADRPGSPQCPRRGMEEPPPAWGVRPSHPDPTQTPPARRTGIRDNPDPHSPTMGVWSEDVTPGPVPPWHPMGVPWGRVPAEPSKSEITSPSGSASPIGGSSKFKKLPPQSGRRPVLSDPSYQPSRTVGCRPVTHPSRRESGVREPGRMRDEASGNAEISPPNLKPRPAERPGECTPGRRKAGDQEPIDQPAQPTRRPFS